MRTPLRVVAAALGTALLAGLIVGACTQRQGSADDELVPTTTTAPTRSSTTGPSATPTTVAGLTADQIRTSLTSAVTARNFCALAAALDDAVPDAKDGQSIIATYEALDSAVRAATSFRPASLADTWPVVVAGVDQGLEAAKRVGGNLADPSLEAPFIADDFQTAMTAMESWEDTNCPAG